MTKLEKIKSVVAKKKVATLNEIYKALPEIKKTVIRGTINKYVNREDKEFQRTERGIYEVIEDNKKENEDMEEEIIMYHVSLDLNVGEKVFTPRIPEYTCKGENNTIKRISVARSIEDAISGFPYKDYFVNDYKRCQKRLLSIYEFKVKKKDIIFSEDLKDYVPDTHITNECWLVKETVGIGRIVDVKEITLSNYNKYAWYYYGTVNHLRYEESIALEDYTLTTIVSNKSSFENLIEILNKYNLKYKISDKGRNKFYMMDMGCSCGTTNEEYDWWIIDIEITKGFDGSELWKVVSKIDREYVNIGAYYKNYAIEDEEEDEEEDINLDIDIHLHHIVSDRYGSTYRDKIGESKYRELFEKVKEKYLSYDGDKEELHEVIEEIVIEVA